MTDQDPLSVQTIDSKGKAPKRRMATPAAAQGAYWTARNANTRRDMRFSDLAGIYAGFPPTPPGVLERNGQADLPNVNLKQFKAKVKTYVDTWNAVNAAGDGWAEVKAEHEDPMEAERRSQYLTKCFNRAIKRWDNTGFQNGGQYVIESAVRDLQMGLYGIGIAMMCDHIDFRWKPIPTRRVLVPEGTRLCMDNCPAVFVEDDISVSDLYGKRDKAGWNKEAIISTLYNKLERMSSTATRRATLAEWTQRVISNDTFLISDFQPLNIVHVYTMEFDGKISHSVITDNSPGQQSSDVKAETSDTSAQGFLFDKANVGERWSQVIIPFSDTSGPEGDWHGVKGFGDDIFDTCHLNNLMFNRAATAAIVSNTLLFNASNEADVNKLNQITITNMGIMHPGLQVEQVQLRGDPQSALGIFSAATSVMDSNSRIFPQNQKNAGGDQPTATQVNYDRADEAQFTTLQLSLYRSIGLDVLLSEMYRRLAQPATKYPESWPGGNVAKQFREEAEEAGIPESELLDIQFVRANRNGGTGNMGIDLMKAKELMGVATPGRGQMNARKEVVSALKGVEMVPAFIEEPEAIPNQEDVQISTENLFIQEGKTPTAFGWQPHEKHLSAHMQIASEIQQVAQQIEEQGIQPQHAEDAMKLVNMLESAIAHSGQHVEFMASIPRTGKAPAMFEQLVKEATKALNNLQQFTESFKESVAAVQQQADPNAGMTPEMLKAQSDIQIKQAKAQSDIEITKAKAQAKLGASAVSQQAKTETRLTDHALKTAMAVENAQQAAAIKAAQAMQDMQIAAMQTKTETTDDD